MQGTKRPTRYITLADEIGLTAVEFQRLTFSLCSTYARATSMTKFLFTYVRIKANLRLPASVSVVPAVYYAHRMHSSML